MAHGGARVGNRRGNWRMVCVASTLHTNSQHGVSSITTADAHTSAVNSRLNWRPRRFKWTRPFRRKTKSGFCACAITFQTQYSITEIVRKEDREFIRPFHLPTCIFILVHNSWLIVDFAVNVTMKQEVSLHQFNLTPVAVRWGNAIHAIATWPGKFKYFVSLLDVKFKVQGYS